MWAYFFLENQAKNDKRQAHGVMLENSNECTHGAEKEESSIFSAA